MENLKDLTFKIIGAAMRVHSELRFGLLEAVYQEALTIELNEMGVHYFTEHKVPIYYKNYILNKHYVLDLLVGDIICELKSVEKLTPTHRAQLCNYLRLTHKPLGLLINFGSNKLESERWAFDNKSNECYFVDKELNPIKDIFNINIYK